MNRAEAFQSLKSDSWFSRVFAKTKASDRELCLKFIEENDGLDRADFEFQVNRMFLDKEKPKNWTLIVELLATSNIKAFPLKREDYVRAR